MHPRLTSGFERLAIGDPDASDWKSSGFERRVCSQLETALHHSQSPGASPRSSWSAASTRAQVLQKGRSWFAASSSACAHLGGAWHLITASPRSRIPADPGRRRRDPHRLSRRARGHLGVHSTGSPCGYYHGARPRSWCCACRVCACLRALMSPVSSGNVR